MSAFLPPRPEAIAAAVGKLGNLSQSQLEGLVQGVAGGYKIARGVHTQVAASDTVATGLANVVAVIVSFASAPTVNQLFCAGLIGNQSGAPAAGSILINTYKPTATNDATPVPATVFSDNVKLAWFAIGT